MERYVPSEGAAGLILKTKSAALRDGDRILGVVRATITKHDGRSQGLVAPNVKAQIGMQIELLEKAGLSPSEIEWVPIINVCQESQILIFSSFMEAHGTGKHKNSLNIFCEVAELKICRNIVGGPYRDPRNQRGFQIFAHSRCTTCHWRF